MAIYSGFLHKKWWFSIVMLVYQSVSYKVILYMVITMAILYGYLMDILTDCNRISGVWI